MIRSLLTVVVDLHNDYPIRELHVDIDTLRQALEALELRCGTHADEHKELIPALRERLRRKAAKESNR